MKTNMLSALGKLVRGVAQRDFCACSVRKLGNELEHADDSDVLLQLRARCGDQHGDVMLIALQETGGDARF